MPQKEIPMTFVFAEKIRSKVGVDPYDFSRILGYSYSSYKNRESIGKLSRMMSREIRRRYARLVKGLKER